MYSKRPAVNDSVEFFFQLSQEVQRCCGSKSVNCSDVMIPVARVDVHVLAAWFGFLSQSVAACMVIKKANTRFAF